MDRSAFSRQRPGAGHGRDTRRGGRGGQAAGRGEWQHHQHYNQPQPQPQPQIQSQVSSNLTLLSKGTCSWIFTLP
jgi:hypothetical protein